MKSFELNPVQAALQELRDKTGHKDSITPNNMADTIDIASGFSGCPVGAVDLTRIGFKLDGTDETKLMQGAVLAHPRLYIPNAAESGTTGVLTLSDSIHMTFNSLFIGGRVDWMGVGKPCFWMHRYSHIEGGATEGTDGERHIYQAAKATAGARGRNDCIILVHKSGGGRGCLQNTVHNLIIDGYGINSAGIYSSEENKEIKDAWANGTPEVRHYCVGKGIWLLAGTDAGLSGTELDGKPIPDYNYMEYVYRNSFTNIRINGFEDGVKLEAGWLWIHTDPADMNSPLIPAPRKNAAGKTLSPNGWVNGNRFDGLWLRNCRNYIHLEAPKGDYYPTDASGGVSKTKVLCGECSGNHFAAVDIQSSSGTYNRGVLVKGSDFNHFAIMHWDAPITSYPLIEFKRGNTNTPVGQNTAQSRNNYMVLTGSKINLSNGGIRDENAGDNTFISNTLSDIHTLPIASNTNTDRRSFLGVVQNYWGNGSNLVDKTVKVYKCNDDGSRGSRLTLISGLYTTGYRQDAVKVLNPEILDNYKLPCSSISGYEFELENEHEVLFNMMGFVYASSEHTHNGCRVTGYNDKGEVRFRHYIHAINAGSGIFTGSSQMIDENGEYMWKDTAKTIPKMNSTTNIKKVVYRFWDKVRPRQGGALSISSLFMNVPKERNDNFHARLDKSNFYTGAQHYSYPVAQGGGSAFTDGWLDSAGKFNAGVPSSEQLREAGYTIKFDVPMFVNQELIMPDTANGKFYKLEVTNGILGAVEVTI